MLKLVHSFRGVAALLVVCFHVAKHVSKQVGDPTWGQGWGFGDAGVQFFFVLSGFIIYYSSRKKQGQPSEYKNFLSRRMLRIYLPYWAVVLPVFVATCLLPQFGEPRHREISTLLGALTLLPIIGDDFLGVAWTLVFEVCFYFFFSLVILSRKFLPWLVLFFFVLGGLRMTGICLPFVTNPNWALFALGIVAGIATEKYDLRPWWRWILGVGVACFIISAFLHVGVSRAGEVPHYDWSVWRFGVSSFLLVVGASFSEFGFWKWLGDSSYSLYLIHIPIIAVTSKMLEKIGPVGSDRPIMMFTLLVGASLVGGFLFCRLVEFPLLRVSKKWLGRSEFA